MLREPLTAQQTPQLVSRELLKIWEGLEESYIGNWKSEKKPKNPHDSKRCEECSTYLIFKQVTYHGLKITQ